MKLKELFEALAGDSKVNFHWENKNAFTKIGYFTFDDKLVYGLRRVEIDGDTIKIPERILFFDFGYFVAGELRYELLKNSVFPLRVLNAVISEMMKDIAPNTFIVAVAKQCGDTASDYSKRVSLYESLFDLRARRLGVQTVHFVNSENENVFVIAHKKPDKLKILKICNQLEDTSWLNINNAKRILRSLK